MRFFSVIDLFAFPASVFLCYRIFFFWSRNEPDAEVRRYYRRAFNFKVISVIIFTLLTEFYFKGGDTSLYFQASKDLQTALQDNSDNIWPIIQRDRLTPTSPLFDYFYYDNYDLDITYGYMMSPPNFFPPKLALIPLYLFGGSYIAINMCFGFFAFLGAIQLYRFFLNYFPALKRELAVGCLFLPSVVYWSSGLLKDPVTFGAVGFVLFGFYNLFIGRNIFSALLAIIICAFFLYIMKVYILLVLILAIVVWKFTEVSRKIENSTLRAAFTFLAFVVAAGVGMLLLQYFTGMEAAQEYQLDNLAGNIQHQQQLYFQINQQLQGKSSHFTIDTGNPISMVFGGLTATFFRPFVWEINTPIALFSSIESNIFLLLTLFFFLRKGVSTFFRTCFSDTIILTCFVFAIVFAIAVGVSTANFGALSRYKIPCMPFYFVLLILVFNKAGLKYPGWFNKILDLAIPPAPLKTI